MKTIDHKFVEYIPEQEDIEEGVIYISLDYDTAVHNCICGCGMQVVTPISPTDWKITYNGESISLYPSIGNWGFECQSHYWIKNNRILLAESWSEEQIKSSRQSDIESKINSYKYIGTTKIEKEKRSLVHRLINLVTRKF